MERVKLEVQARIESGTRAARRMRKLGVIPGVLYGHGGHAHMLAVSDRVLREAVSGGSGMHAVIDISFEGQKTVHTAVIKDYQLDPVKHVITHIDFNEVRLSDPIEAKVAVVFEGQAAGTKVGGILDVLMRDVTVKALPTLIPEHLALDVTALEIGDTAHVGDLVLPDDVEVLDDDGETLCSVLLPRKVAEGEGEEGEEGVEEAAADSQEPELIGHGKGEDEES